MERFFIGAFCAALDSYNFDVGSTVISFVDCTTDQTAKVDENKIEEINLKSVQLKKANQRMGNQKKRSKIKTKKIKKIKRKL